MKRSYPVKKKFTTEQNKNGVYVLRGQGYTFRTRTISLMNRFAEQITGEY